MPAKDQRVELPGGWGQPKLFVQILSVRKFRAVIAGCS